MSRLSSFLRANIEAILDEWETFARSLPLGGDMDVAALRDHAREMLNVIARDLDRRQSAQQQVSKALGLDDAAVGERTRTAAQDHGAGRATQGFSVDHMVAEFRALRASVVRLWSSEFKEASLSDLEDLIRFNEAIDQAIAESITRFAQEVGESKERFLAILAHDLRTPLGAIITSSKFMLDAGELDEPNRTLVTRIGSSSQRMNRMVLDLLDFVRTRFGDSIPVARVATDARRVLNDMVAEIAASYPSTRIHLETTGNLHGTWDGDRLMQALVNLVSNAVQHGFEKSPVWVSARGHDREVEIRVKNEGPVIPPEQVSRIFQPMKGSAGAPSRDRRHLGLGLYIVDKIVTAHGGTIGVESSKAEGTQFIMRLPREAP